MLIEHKATDFKKYLQVFADVLKLKPDGNFVHLNEKSGNGFLYADIFTSGISVLISDMELKEELTISRHGQHYTHFFILLINENITKETKNNADETEDVFNLGSSMSRLVSSFLPNTSILPAKSRAKSFAILFNKQTLLELFGAEVTDKFVSGYFSSFLKQDFTAPVDTESRSILHETVAEIFDHPLSKTFIENRTLLLLEKFMLNFLLKMPKQTAGSSLRDDEVNRLMLAETMLLKDYSNHPPTIDILSRACAMSPTKFKNDFKTLYGLPVFEYYQKNRMQHARSLLRKNANTIKEIGAMVGYTNLGHFAAAFKKEFGILPSEMQQVEKVDMQDAEMSSK